MPPWSCIYMCCLHGATPVSSLKTLLVLPVYIICNVVNVTVCCSLTHQESTDLFYLTSTPSCFHCFMLLWVQTVIKQIKDKKTQNVLVLFNNFLDFIWGLNCLLRWNNFQVQSLFVCLAFKKQHCATPVLKGRFSSTLTASEIRFISEN